VFAGFAQNISEGEQKVEDDAFMFFTQKDYEKAMPLFSQLLSLHPQDPSYNYGYGVCLIETNTDTKGAMKYLKFAQSKSQNPVIFYYIGKSYHLTYQFDKAIANYQHFKEKAPKPTLKEFDIDQKIRMAENGKQLINYVSDLIVLDNKKIKDENFYYSYRLDDFGGKLIITPKDFKTKVDIKKKYRGITFIWNDAEAFYASYGNNKKGSLDIYRVHRNFDNTWSEPVKLGLTINSPYDENFPYLSPDGKTFYFSSKGFNSMGGYDIFKSSYDSKTGQFSKPENMDFPINSPFDDLLYVTDINNQYAYFASKRETGNDEISVYRILVDKNRHKRPVENMDEVIEKAKLNITPVAERSQVNEIETNNVEAQEVSQNDDDEVLTFPELKPKAADSSVVVKQAIDDDIQSITENIKQTENARDRALVEAYDKSQQAKALRNKANQILKGLDQIPDEEEQAFLQKEAQGMLSDATKLSQEAITAYHLNKHLDQTVQYKKQDLAKAQDFAKHSTENSNVDSLLKAYNNARKQFNQNQDKYTTVDKEVKQRNKLIAGNLAEIKKNQAKLTDLESQISKTNDDITVTGQQINSATANEKPALQEKLKKQKNQLTQLMQEKANVTNKTNYLTAQNEGLNNEVKYLRSFKQNSKDTEIGEVHQKMAEIDLSALSKDIAKTETDLEMDLAQQVAKKQESTSHNENLVAENTQSNQTQDIQNTAEKTTSGNTNSNEIAGDNTTASNLQTHTKSSNETVADSLQTITDHKKEQTNQSKDLTERQDLKQESTSHNENLVAENTQSSQTQDIQNTAGKTTSGNTNSNEIAGNKTAASNLQTHTKSSNETVADSLQTIIDQKKEQISRTSDPTEKQKLQGEVSDLAQILNTIHPQQNETLIQTNKTNTQTPENKTETIESRFPDMEIKPDDDASTKYEKTLFKQQYLSQLVKEQDANLENLKTIRKTADTPEPAQSLDKEIAELSKKLENNRKQLSETQKQVAELKQNVEKTQKVKQMSDAELILKASKYTPKNVVTIVDNPEDKQQLADLKKKTDNQYYNYLQLKKETDDLQKRFDQSGDKDIEKQLIESKQKQENAFNTYLTNANRLNTLNYYYYDDKIFDAQVVSNSQESQNANKLTNEAEYYFNLSKSIQESAKTITDESLREKELEKSLAFQKVAIEKQKHALDLYITAGNLAAKKTPKSDEKELVQLSPDDLSTLKTANKLYYKSTVLEKESQNLRTEAETLEKEAENTYEEKKKTALITKSQEKKKQAIEKHIQAIQNSITADSLKFSVNAPVIDSLLAKNTNKNARSIANLYVKESYTYNNAANQLRIRAINETNPDSLLALNTRIQQFYKKSVNNQQYAIAALTKEQTTNFIAVSPITELNQLTTINKSVETRNIPEVDEKLLFANLKFNEEDQKALDLANKIEQKSIQKINKAKEIDKQNIELEHIIETSDNPKEVNAAKKKLAKQQSKKLLLLADAYDDYEPINYTRYDILKSQLRQAKKGGDKTHRKEAIQLSINAQKDFQKAARIRDASFMIKDRASVAKDLEKAYNLERKAISQIEKSIALYKGLITNVEEQPLLANSDTAINTNEFAVKQTGDVTHVDVNQEDTTESENLIVENTTKKMPSDTTNNTVLPNDTDFYNRSTFDNTDTSQTTENLVQLPIDEKDITFSFPPQMKAGNTYSVTAVINNDKLTKAFARFKIALPKGLVAKNMSSIGAESTFEEQIVKFLWMNLPEGEIKINFQIEANNTTYLADSVHAIFEYAFNGGVQKIGVQKYFEVQPPEILAENRNASDTTNNESESNINTNDLTDNTNNNSQADNVTENNVNNNQNNSNEATYTQSVKTVSNNDVPYSYVDFNAYSSDNPIPVNPSLPKGIIFKIQLGAFSKLIPDNTFKGLNPIVAEKSQGSRYYKYMLGEFQTFDAAQVGKTEVKNMGYRDAFIVAYKDGKRIPIYQARNLISQANDKDYQLIAQEEINKIKNRTTSTNTSNVTPSNVETAQPVYTSISNKKDLVFTVQIGVFKKQPEPSYFRGLSPVFDEKTPYGFIRYFTGSFASIEKATAEKNKIVRLGIKDAFVTAYYNGKRISLTEASKLAGEGKSTGRNEDIIYPETAIPEPKSTVAYDKADIWFSVQVGAYKNTVPLNEVSSLVNISRNNEIKQIKDDKGYTLFIIGKFISYEKAKELSNILKNDGVTDCFVIAFGKQQKIPVADAIAIMKGQ